MADTNFISQDVIQAGADDAEHAVSQAVVQAGADDAAHAVSQAVVQAGANDAAHFISGTTIQAGVDDAAHFVSQYVIQYSLGPLVPPPAAVRTFRFDAGNRSHYWLALQPSDSGDELRSKVIKAGRVTAKVTNASFQIYKWDVGEEINVAEVEAGTNAATRRQSLPDVGHVTQSARKQVNVPNAVLHSLRVQGTWTGDAVKDRIDELAYEVAQQGVRR